MKMCHDPLQECGWLVFCVIYPDCINSLGERIKESFFLVKMLKIPIVTWVCHEISVSAFSTLYVLTNAYTQNPDYILGLWITLGCMINIFNIIF